MILENEYCEKCGEKYTNTRYKWCKPCQINDLNWTSGDEKIDVFIQEAQLKINYYIDTILEWIPYNQFNDINEISKNGLVTVYSATWKDGPLHYKKRKWTRVLNKKVSLECLGNSQYNIDKFLKEV
jgi:hypothetical protein